LEERDGNEQLVSASVPTVDEIARILRQYRKQKGNK
jgi:hypothetical protein